MHFNLNGFCDMNPGSSPYMAKALRKKCAFDRQH